MMSAEDMAHGGSEFAGYEMTRRKLLQGAAVLGVAVGVGGPLAACGGSGSSASPAASPTAGLTRKKGGNLRIAMSGSTRATLDAHLLASNDDEALCMCLYDTLYRWDSATAMPTPMLATEITPNDAAGSVWTIKLRPDVVFHNGRTLSADDVIFSFQRIVNPKTHADLVLEILNMSQMDVKRLKKVDNLTVEVPLKKPNAIFTHQMAEERVKIVPVGYDPNNPVGTGPFKYSSFVPGETATFVANHDYWGEGPYVDQVEITFLTDETARINALLSGTVELVAQLPFGTVKTISSSSGFAVLNTPSGNWDPMNMLCSKAPFDDLRVRQAFRLIADREEIVRLALNGFGRIGNDLNAPYEPGYPRDLPQRQQDIEKAKSLLKAAGQEGLKLDFVTSPMDQGLVEAAQVFAQQAAKAGVTLNIRKVDQATFWDQYEPSDMKVPFTNEYWNARPYLDQTVLSIGTAAGSRNICHWVVPEWDKLVAEAIGTTDETKRNELVGEAMTIEYNVGPHIVYGFKNAVDGFSTKVVGLKPNKMGLPLNQYQFNLLSFA